MGKEIETKRVWVCEREREQHINEEGNLEKEMGKGGKRYRVEIVREIEREQERGNEVESGREEKSICAVVGRYSDVLMRV